MSLDKIFDDPELCALFAGFGAPGSPPIRNKPSAKPDTQEGQRRWLWKRAELSFLTGRGVRRSARPSSATATLCGNRERRQEDDH